MNHQTNASHRWLSGLLRAGWRATGEGAAAHADDLGLDHLRRHRPARQGLQGGAERVYYEAGGTRIAMHQNGTLLWLLGDHVGSTHMVANRDGSFHSEQLYKPWGGKRYPAGAPTLPTTIRYTGQRAETRLGPSGGEGLYYYRARHYDPYLNN